MSDELTRALISETTIEDIADTYRPVAEIIGVEKFLALCEYAMGDELYFPKAESILASARNRRIKKEWNGHNVRELAEKYSRTTQQIRNIVRNEPVVDQSENVSGRNEPVVEQSGSVSEGKETIAMRSRRMRKDEPMEGQISLFDISNDY